jgi:small ligand-binding sensory domain FIST
VAGRVVEGGVSGVLLGGALDVAVGLSQGCSPIGPTHRVTRGEGHILAALDDRPALEVLCQDLGVADEADPRPWLSNIHAALPVAGSDMGDYLVRNLIGIEPSQGLVVIGDEIGAGDRLLFVRRDAESASKDLQRMLDDLNARIKSPPKAGLYFSCMARGPNLFSDEGHELKAIRETFGDIPIAGFFGNGEISHDRLYGYTGVLTLFL